MLLTELFIEGIKVDLSESTTVPLNLQLDDILSPGKIKNNFSKSVYLPNTQNNNKLFGNIWSINKDIYIGSGTNIGVNFNPSKKANFKIFYNGDLLESGYCKLTNILVDDVVWKYEVNLFGAIGNFITSLGNDTISDSLPSFYDQTVILRDKTIYNLYTAYSDPGKKSRYNIANLDTFYNGSNIIDLELDNTTYYNDKLIDIIDAENGLFDTSNKVQWKTGSDISEDLNDNYTEQYMRLKNSSKQRFGIYTDMILQNFTSKYGYTIDWGNFRDRYNPYWFNTLLTGVILKNKGLNAYITNDTDIDLSISTTSTTGTIDASLNEIANTTDIVTNAANIFIPSTVNTTLYNIVYTLSTGVITLTGLPVYGTTKVWDMSINASIELLLHIYYYDGTSSTTKYNSAAYKIKIVSQSASDAVPNDYFTTTMSATQTAGQNSANVLLYNKKTSAYESVKSYIESLLAPISLIGINYIDSYQVVKATCTKTSSTTFIKDQTTTTLNINQVGINISLEGPVTLSEVDIINDLSTISIKEMIPKIKIADFFLSYVRMFGLVVDVNDEEKHIKISTKNEFYGDKVIKDWSSRLIRDDQFSIDPLNFNKRYLRFGYKKDNNTALEKSYTSATGKYYGEKLVDTGYEFSNDIYDVLDSQFSPVMSQDLTSTILGPEDSRRYKTIPVLADRSNDKLTNANVVGLVFMNGYIPQNSSYKNTDIDGIHTEFVGTPYNQYKSNSFRHNKSNSLPFINSDGILKYITTGTSYILTKDTTSSIDVLYKESGDCYPDMKDVAYSLAFGKPEIIYHNVQPLNYLENSTIYDRCWKAYITDRYNVNTKVMTANFMLSIKDIIDFKFSDFIFIDNTLWVVNKIIDYDVTNNKPTKVELVKVNDIENYASGQII